MFKENNTINYQQIKLISATLDDYPITQNMARFYLYDMTEYMGFEPDWEMPADGLYECVDFKEYWLLPETFPFLIRFNDELVGFVIVDKKGSDSTIDFNIAEFFISRKFIGKGVGRYVARQCFEQFKGVWEIMVYPKNLGAYHFWKTVVAQYTRDNFIEYTRHIAHLDNTQKDIIRFESLNT